jgi:hypothetical protein
VIEITSVCPVPHQSRAAELRTERSSNSAQIGEPSHYAVALAGAALQLLSVKNTDSTALRSNDPSLLQLANCRGDRRATTAKYLGENFMGKRQDVRPSTITAHTEPAGEALRHLMQAITGGTLGHLHRLGVGIAAKHLFQLRRLRQCLSEQVRSYPETASLGLSDRANGSATGTEDDWNPDKSLASCNANFNRCSVAHHCNKRNHSSSGEIYGHDGLVGFPEYFSRFHQNKTQILLKEIAFLLRERGQNHVFRVLRFGWIVNVWLLSPRLDVPSSSAPLVLPGHDTSGRISNPEGRWPAFPFLSSLIAVISYVM